MATRLKEADVVVVGLGAAGGTAVWPLAQSGMDIVGIEAGPRVTEKDYPFDEMSIFHDPAAPRMQFVEHSFAGDPTNWWIPNAACMEAMLRSAGSRIEARRGEDIYVCRCGDRNAYADSPPLPG